MKTTPLPVRLLAAKSWPLLENGDRMTQAEFHRRYEASPEDAKFELVAGTVYKPARGRVSHSDLDVDLGWALGMCGRATRGVEFLPRTTIILGEESEPEPDLTLRILPEYGGQSRSTADDYVAGPPELIGEIAYSRRSIDRHQKRVDYRRAGVVEYVVVCVEEREIHWFDFKVRRLIRPSVRGVYRSRIFPGLWIDGPALLGLKSQQVEKVAREGLASKEHAAFVKELQSRL